MKNKRNIFLVGPMGAGKSSIGKQLAQQLKMEFYDTDQVIEERTGADIDWIFDLEGEQGFRTREEGMIEELTQMQGIVLATGGGAVISPKNRTLLAARGTVIYLETSIEQQLERTRRDKKRPLLQTNDEPRKVFEDLRDTRNPLYDEISDYTFSTDGSTVKAVARFILDGLQR
ncbi:MAG: shikimate kinase AroK [Gammaproteobacteria bacterium]|nr:MAG: shikimate kinase AroK [Gammaproteobacteria bacterium]